MRGAIAGDDDGTICVFCLPHGEDTFGTREFQMLFVEIEWSNYVRSLDERPLDLRRIRRSMCLLPDAITVDVSAHATRMCDLATW